MGKHGVETMKLNEVSTVKANNNKCKVSIVVPCYNVESYIDKCLKSIISQTLKEIEIICVNDGSTDSTLKRIQVYANNDSRIKIINKKNSGYGDSMNKGMAMATGEYLGIVESDDFIESTMFEKLYNVAVTHDADIVKSNFWLYWSKDERKKVYEYFAQKECDKVIVPREYDNSSLFGRKPSIWSAIYKRDFLKKYNIDFLTTAGASYQDTSFTFKAYMYAERMVCVYDAFLYYRQDNEGSSVNNIDKKIDFIFKEYEEIASFIKKSQFDKQHLYTVYSAMFYDVCIWAYELLSPKYRYSFLKRVQPIFKKFIEEIGVNNINFRESWWKRRDIVRIAENPYEYHMWRNDERYDQNYSKQSFRATKTPLNNVEQIGSTNRFPENPFFSVIMPVYNVEKYLPSALDSLIYQKYDNFEIICVNDGSDDSSLSILEKYAAFDNRIVIVNQDNSGPSIARNKGLSVSRGKYILFMDADDLYSENAFEVLTEQIKQNGSIDVIEFGATTYPSVMEKKDWIYSVLTVSSCYYDKISVKSFIKNKNMQIYVWRYCFKNEFLKANEFKFDEEFKYGEDALFLINAIPHACGVLIISNQLYYYRNVREKSLMNDITQYTSKYALQQLKILEKMLADLNAEKINAFPELLEYACDFVYGSIDKCQYEQKLIHMKHLLAILKKYKLDKFVNECSDNCQGFYQYCKEAVSSKRKHYFRAKFKRQIAKLIWPSRRLFNDNSARLINEINKLQRSINLLQQQIVEINSKLGGQKKQ